MSGSESESAALLKRQRLLATEHGMRRWMSERAELLSRRRLSSIVLPGTHDSATKGLATTLSHDDCGSVFRQMPCCIGQCIVGCGWPVIKKSVAILQ